jgi:hypothetical protein
MATTYNGLQLCQVYYILLTSDHKQNIDGSVTLQIFTVRQRPLLFMNTKISKYPISVTKKLNHFILCNFHLSSLLQWNYNVHYYNLTTIRYPIVHSTITVLLYHFHTQTYDTIITSTIKSRHREAPHNSVKVKVSSSHTRRAAQNSTQPVLYASAADFCSTISGHAKLHLYVQYLSP